MADEETPETPETPATGTPAEPPAPAEPEDTAAIKAALKKANKEAETTRLKLKEYEDRDKTETQKLAEDRDGHKIRADSAEGKLARLEIALEKGLTPSQAKRLVGSTREELEADADELIADLGGKKKAPVTGKPTERLRAGGDPDEEPHETDPDKLAAAALKRAGY